jgi:hypothetical protein
MVKGQVLVLNANGAPLDVVDVKKAVGMLMRDAVLAIDGTAARLRTAGGEVFHVPSVLAVKRFVNAPRDVAWSRQGVLRRDEYTCIYCGERLRRSDCTIDHLRPRSRGGESTWGNTACACRECNGRKADRWPHEAGMGLLWEPKRPRWDCIRISGEVPVEWKAYLPG